MDILIKIIIGGIIVSAIIGVIYAIVNEVKRTIRRKLNTVLNVGTLLSSVGEMEAATPKSVGGATNMFAEQIKRDFPNFHLPDAEYVIVQFISDIIHMQYGRRNEFISDKVSMSKDNVHKTSSGNIGNIKINKIVISNYIKSNLTATIVYRCSVGFDLDDKRVETRYEVSYSTELKSDASKGTVINCPNCGAAISITSDCLCEYCKSQVYYDSILNWMITSVEEL